MPKKRRDKFIEGANTIENEAGFSEWESAVFSLSLHLENTRIVEKLHYQNKTEEEDCQII